MELVDYEKLTDVTVMLYHLDLNNPKQLHLKINLTSKPPLHCLLVLGLVQVLISGRVLFFFTFQENPIKNISQFHFSIMKNLSFHVSTFLQECCLAEGPRPILYLSKVGNL